MKVAMTTRGVSGIVLLGAVLGISPPGRLAAAPPDDYWQGWRARQRAELATLSQPPAPPEGVGQPIDRFLAAHWAKHQVTPAVLVGDRAFARRVYLDVIGLLPTAEQLEQFE